MAKEQISKDQMLRVFNEYLDQIKAGWRLSRVPMIDALPDKSLLTLDQVEHIIKMTRDGTQLFLTDPQNQDIDEDYQCVQRYNLVKTIDMKDMPTEVNRAALLWSPRMPPIMDQDAFNICLCCALTACIESMISEKWIDIDDAMVYNLSDWGLAIDIGKELNLDIVGGARLSLGKTMAHLQKVGVTFEPLSPNPIELFHSLDNIYYVDRGFGNISGPKKIEMMDYVRQQAELKQGSTAFYDVNGRKVGLIISKSSEILLRLANESQAVFGKDPPLVKIMAEIDNDYRILTTNMEAVSWLYNEGPVLGMMDCYHDFFYYQHGVYDHVNWDFKLAADSPYSEFPLDGLKREFQKCEGSPCPGHHGLSHRQPKPALDLQEQLGGCLGRSWVL